MERRLRRLLSRFDGRQVLVLGDLMLDEWVWGKVSRISPEAPIPVVDVHSITYSPGGACNVACNIIALGGRVRLFGLVGDDEAGQRLLGELDKRGIEVSGLLVDPSRPTTRKTRIVAHNQQVVRADRESRAPLTESMAKELLGRLEKVLHEVDIVLVSDYAKGVVIPKLLTPLIAACQEARRAVVVDPKGTDYSKYARVTVITPNEAEAAQATHVEIVDSDSLLRAGKTLLAQLGCQAVLITRGEHGMSLFEAGGKVTHLPTFAREVYDVTGAGDTAVATLSLALACGATFVEAACLANHAAGVVVGKVGTATVSRQELLNSIADNCGRSGVCGEGM